MIKRPSRMNRTWRKIKVINIFISITRNDHPFFYQTYLYRSCLETSLVLILKSVLIAIHNHRDIRKGWQTPFSQFSQVVFIFYYKLTTFLVLKCNQKRNIQNVQNLSILSIYVRQINASLGNGSICCNSSSWQYLSVPTYSCCF